MKNRKEERFVIGSGKRFENKILAKKIISIFKNKLNFKKKISLTKVKDRPGHDKEYKIDCSKLNSLGWNAKTDMENDLVKTIKFYLKKKI